MKTNVLTQAVQMFGSAGGDALSKLSSGTGAGFGQVMSDSLQNRLDSSGNRADAVKPGASPGKQFSAKPVTDKQEAAVVTGNTSKEAEVQKEISPETAKAVEEGMKQLVQEKLGLTEEELEEAMAVLGLGYLDLLMPENMKALVLEVNQADAMDLLTNEGLNDQLASLLQGTEELLLETGMEPSMEELPELLESLKEAAEPKEPMQETVEEDGKQPKVEILVEKNVSKESVENETEAQEEVVGQKAVSTEKTEENAGKEETKNEFQDKRQDSRRDDISGEQNRNPMDTLIQNLSNQVSLDKGVVEASQRVEVMRDIVNQVLDQIRIHIKPDTTSMELTLNPENLGKISLTVISKEGHLTASFTAQNQVTKEALESQMQTLKENLNNQGIKVEAIEVNIESFAFDERNQMSGGQGKEGQSKPKEKKFSADGVVKAFGEEAAAEEELSNTAAITQSGGNVDYTA